MFRRILSLFLVVCMLLGLLTGCSSSPVSTILEMIFDSEEDTDPSEDFFDRTQKHNSKNDKDSDTDSDRDTDRDSTKQETTQPTQAGISVNNPYARYFTPDTYLLPDSATRYLSQQDLSYLSRDEVLLAMYEITARRGGVAEDVYAQEFFEEKSWYQKGTLRDLTEVEQTNRELLEVTLAYLDGTLQRSGNPYIQHLQTPDHAYFPHSSTDYLTAEELMDLTETELAVVHGEILARYGCIFEDPYLQEFFFCKSWYTPALRGMEQDDSLLSDVEKYNIALIEVYKTLCRGVTFTNGNPYQQYLNNYPDGILFHDSGTRELYSGELYYLTPEELTLARNEVYARYGYTFKDEELFEYYAQCDWYHPNTAPGNNRRFSLNKVENRNVDLLQRLSNAIKKAEDLDDLDRSMSYKMDFTYFSVTVPKYWKDFAVANDQGWYVSFHEKLSYDISGGGYLFDIAVYTGTEFLGSYDSMELGTLTGPNGDVYYVVATFPSDYSCANWNLEALYDTMCSDAGAVCGWLTPAPGYTYTPVDLS